MKRVIKQNSDWWLSEKHIMYEYHRYGEHWVVRDLGLVASI